MSRYLNYEGLKHYTDIYIKPFQQSIAHELYGFRIDKNNANSDTRVEYLFDAVGKQPAYMDFNSGTFNYGDWADVWFVKNNRPVALKFDGTVDYELSHTDFTKKIDGTTASDVEDVNYAGNFMSEIPLVYVNRWEDDNYNYMAFSNVPINDNFKAYAHTNAYGYIQDVIYLPMFKGYKDSNNKLRSLMGTNPTGSTTATNDVTYASNCGEGWQIYDKAKTDLIMDLILLITKSTNCRAKIGNGVCNNGYSMLVSGYEADGTTRSTNAQFYGYEGTETTDYGKHHMIAFYVEDLWSNRCERCLGFNLVDGVYKVKMVAPYSLDSDSSYTTLTVSPPSAGYIKNISSNNIYGDVPISVGATGTTGFASFFYRTNGTNIAAISGGCYDGTRNGRYLYMSRGDTDVSALLGSSPVYIPQIRNAITDAQIDSL